LFSIVWLYSKPTEGWMEGQIELRTIGHNGSFENWRIYIVVDKISDRKIFIALDDFTFRLVLLFSMLFRIKIIYIIYHNNDANPTITFKNEQKCIPQ